MCGHINVGNIKDLNIKELTEIIREVVGFNGKINFDRTKPDGTLRKLIDSEHINNLGFQNEASLKNGLIKINKDYLISY